MRQKRDQWRLTQSLSEPSFVIGASLYDRPYLSLHTGVGLVPDGSGGIGHTLRDRDTHYRGDTKSRREDPRIGGGETLSYRPKGPGGLTFVYHFGHRGSLSGVTPALRTYLTLVEQERRP